MLALIVFFKGDDCKGCNDCKGTYSHDKILKSDPILASGKVTITVVYIQNKNVREEQNFSLIFMIVQLCFKYSSYLKVNWR